ncbi:MAG TPA: ATP-binding protein [Anaerovoracaceae bacterium]|nr:ATP-binding protein [Anaerovoracaceae bacterium]
MRKFLQKGKAYLLENEGRIRSGVEFVGKCMEDIATITQLQSPSVANYLATGFKVKKHYKEVYDKGIQDFFLNDSWELIFTHEVWPVAAQILERGYINKIEIRKKEGESSKNIHVCHLSGELKIGWLGHDKYIDAMYVSAGMAEEAKKLLETEVWNIFKTNCITVGAFKHNWNTYFSINNQEDHKKFVECHNGKKFAEYMKTFQEQKIGRSVLFYGPPGSGKSNIVKAVSNALGLKTVRLNNLDNIRNQAIVSIMDIFNPDAIIIEDIDHLYSHDISTLLEKIENFNMRGKYVLATANEVTKINSALLRPGRFDELIEVLAMSEEALRALIEDDQEIYEIVKDYPVAFVMELLKRIKAMGKKEALANMNDLKKRVEMLQKAEYKL